MQSNWIFIIITVTEEERSLGEVSCTLYYKILPAREQKVMQMI